MGSNMHTFKQRVGQVIKNISLIPAFLFLLMIILRPNKKEDKDLND